MGLLTTTQVGLSYLASMIHKLPEDNLENFYVNRIGRKLYSMFSSITRKTSGADTPGKSMPLGALSG